MRVAAFLTAMIAFAGLLAFTDPALGQADEEAACTQIELGELGELTSTLTASGSWTGDECDESQFLENRPGRMYSFTLAEDAVVRIDLVSPDRDAELYLLSASGRLLESDDDTGLGNNARIEKLLSAGEYQIEAGAFGWSGRESGAFELTMRIVEGCEEVVDLGTLNDPLNAEGVWSHFGCESAFRIDRSSQRYRFQVDRSALVQIDVTSPTADPFIYLLDEQGRLLDLDDDGGTRFNSRIVRLLGAGTYTVEATNWGDRDLKNLQESPHEIRIALAEAGPRIKLEAIEAPERVVLGIPFDINYRVGNLGDAPLASIDASVEVRVRWPYISDWRTRSIAADDGEIELWDVGASYHTSESVAAFGSQEIPQLHPFRGAFRWRTGPTDVMLEVRLLDEDGDRIDRHFLARPIFVLSGFEYEALTVSVDDVDYQVAATADETGEVTTTVNAVGGEDEDTVDAEITARAIYAAGVRTQVLDDFEETTAALSASAESLLSKIGRGGQPLSDVPSAEAPTLDALIETLNAAHSETLDQFGFDASQFLGANTAEAIVVRAGRAAAKRIEQLARSWGHLMASDRVLSSEEALQVHSQLAFAEHVDVRLIEAAELLLMAREANDGWDDPAVEEARVAYARGIDCAPDARALAFGDDVLRFNSLIYEHMLDRAYCGALAANDEHDHLLSGLDLERNPEIPEPEVVDQPVLDPQIVVSRLLARVLDDGRIEFAVDLSNGVRVEPTQRKLQANSEIDRWLRTSPVMFQGEELGRIYARRLDDGLVQATFVPAGADMETTARWIMPDDAPVDAWLISGVLAATQGDDPVQQVAGQTASAGVGQLGDHLSLLEYVENNLQRNP